MSLQVKGSAVMQIPVDTASLNPDSLKAVLTVGVEMLEADLERKLTVIDWSRIEIAIHHDKKPGGTSLLVLRGPIL